MTEQESDTILSHSTKSNIQQTQTFLKLLPSGHIYVDWSDLPKHRHIEQCVIHYRSLNNNRSHAVHVSRKKRNFTLEKVQAGHLYEIHVCMVDSSNRIIASTEHAQIQTKTLNEAPILRVIKSTPDCIWLEWEKPNSVRQADIAWFRLMINGETKGTFPSTETHFVVNDGAFGERYVFQIEMIRKDKKMTLSLPVSVVWPGVTIPKRHAFANGCEELVICWGDSISINDGNIEFYTLHLFDSNGQQIKKIGPTSNECRQVVIQEVAKGVYFYQLEIKLANSNQSLFTKPIPIICGRESIAPVLICDDTGVHNQKQLLNMAYHLINIRDNMKSKRFLEKCDKQLKEILSTFTGLTDSVRLTLNIQSRLRDNSFQSYQLFIDGQESHVSLPMSVKNFPLELPRRDKPYELTISTVPDFHGVKSKKVLIEASGHFSFFCDHFNQNRYAESCSYMDTLSREKQSKRSINQDLIKSPQQMPRIQVYNIKGNKMQYLPSNDTHRITIILFYINQCVPSIAHLNYLSAYAKKYSEQNNYISINCNQDIEGVKNSIQDINHIQCCTDFSSEDFEFEHKENEEPLHEILPLEGTPTYFILDFSSHIVWKGRLCIQNQSEYNTAMDHLVSHVNQIACQTDNCQLCNYTSMNDSRIDSELNDINKNLQSINQQKILQIENKKQDDKHNRIRRVVSMKTK